MQTPMRPQTSADQATGLRVEARRVTRTQQGKGRVLHDVSLGLSPGQLTVIVGSSGAGKTALLETLAGLRVPSEGEVLHDGAQPGLSRGEFGYVPQEDILHRELPLRRALLYTAGLRMPGASSTDIAATVDRLLATLGLSAQATTTVRALSSGERKRAGLAAELLTRPRVLFLDEPTSRLDPVSSAELLRIVRILADGGTTVVLTSHTLADIDHCDQVVFLNPQGEAAYVGTPDDLCAAFSVSTFDEVYGAVADGAQSEYMPYQDLPDSTPTAPPTPWPRVGALRQWALLTRRSSAVLLHNRRSVAVLVGSPVAIVLMLAVLFRPGVFDPASPDPGSSAMLTFWVAFGAFFFGLAYGLLQICTELPVLRRERLAGLRMGAYVASKLTTTIPALAVADALLLVVLRALGRLPAAGGDTYTALFLTSLLASAAALALGLLASATVTAPSQATLLLPLLCFPQVLFSGAVVPVPQMPAVGEAVSWLTTNRWAAEALGSTVDLEKLWSTDTSPAGPPLLASYGDSFAHPAFRGWLILAGFTVFFLALTWRVLIQKCQRH